MNNLTNEEDGKNTDVSDAKFDTCFISKVNNEYINSYCDEFDNTDDIGSTNSDETVYICELPFNNYKDDTQAQTSVRVLKRKYQPLCDISSTNTKSNTIMKQCANKPKKIWFIATMTPSKEMLLKDLLFSFLLIKNKDMDYQVQLFQITTLDLTI